MHFKFVTHSVSQSVTGVTSFTFWFLAQEYIFAQKILYNKESSCILEYFYDCNFCVKLCLYKSKNYFCDILQTFFLSFCLPASVYLFVCMSIYYFVSHFVCSPLSLLVHYFAPMDLNALCIIKFCIYIVEVITKSFWPYFTPLSLQSALIQRQ